MFHLVYYNPKLEVKIIPLQINEEDAYLHVSPDEDYFIIGLTHQYQPIHSFSLVQVLEGALTPYEHFFSMRQYCFNFELRNEMFRASFEFFRVDFNNILRQLIYDNPGMPQ